jgi:hypothetical protein
MTTSKDKKKTREYNLAYNRVHRKDRSIHNKAYHAAHRAESRAYRAAHRKEFADYDLAWRQAHREESRKWRRTYHLAKNYGLTPEQHDALYANQEGKCAICGRHEDKLGVDHNHSTKQVRGLLCLRCNAVIGMAYDDTDILLSAIKYLDRWNALAEFDAWEKEK